MLSTVGQERTDNPVISQHLTLYSVYTVYIMLLISDISRLHIGRVAICDKRIIRKPSPAENALYYATHKQDQFYKYGRTFYASNCSSVITADCAV